MRFVLAVISALSLLGLVISLGAIKSDPFAGYLAFLCLLLFVVAAGFAAVLSHMAARDRKLDTVLKDIAASNAAMSIAIQNRSKAV